MNQRTNDNMTQSHGKHMAGLHDYNRESHDNRKHDRHETST